jgi:hypothetical protein
MIKLLEYLLESGLWRIKILINHLRQVCIADYTQKLETATDPIILGMTIIGSLEIY